MPKYIVKSEATYKGKDYVAYWNGFTFKESIRDALELTNRREAEKVAKQWTPKGYISKTRLSVVSLNK